MQRTNADFRCLYEWQSPNAMFQVNETIKTDLGSEILSRLGRDYREAFVACRFAKARDANAVRLLEVNNHAPTPDFAIMLGESELWYETTETDRPERKRGDEASLDSGKWVSVPDEEWTTPELYCLLVEQRVNAKAQKKYGKCDGLVIYSNAFPIEREEALTTDWWRKAAETARDKFAETWVYKSSRFTRLF